MAVSAVIYFVPFSFIFLRQKALNSRQMIQLKKINDLTELMLPEFNSYTNIVLLWYIGLQCRPRQDTVERGD